MDDDTPTPLTPRQVLRQADALRALVKNAEEVLHALNMGGYDNNWLLVHPADSRVERRQAVSLPLLLRMQAALRDVRDESIAAADRLDATVILAPQAVTE